jgi:hypothetical protein
MGLDGDPQVLRTKSDQSLNPEDLDALSNNKLVAATAIRPNRKNDPPNVAAENQFFDSKNRIKRLP